MIRLRQSIEAGVRHPLLGPLLLILLALVLAFVALNTIEDGVEGVLLSCAIMAAVSLRLLVAALGRARLGAAHQLPPFGRAPPGRVRRLLSPSRVPPILVAFPLRL